MSQIIDKNIFFITKKDIEEPLKKVEFLGKIEVKKKYPNTIVIKVYETKPIAIVFKNNNKYLLDNLSNLISYKEESKDFYPTIFGKGADENFANFFEKLEENNFPYKMVKNYYYFQIGRWDLKLFNNKVIKLPYKDVDAAIIKSIELLNRDDFKNYNIIDLRVDGKIIVE